MKEIFLKTLDNIYNEIEDSSSISLLGGGPGIALFKLYYLKHVKNGDLSDLTDNIKNLSELSFQSDNIVSFCTGQAGINWFFSHLYDQNCIEKKDYKLINSSNYSLAEASMNYLSIDMYDFLHGGTGIAHHLLYKKNKDFNPFFDAYLTKLISLMDKEHGILYYYDFETNQIDKSKVNPSLSHGLSSVLKLCLECYKNGISRKKAKFISTTIINFLLKNINPDTTISYFPYMFDSLGIEEKISRLSWCYGDLTIAFVMYQYGLIFEDQRVIDKALEIMIHSSKRRSPEDSGINNGAFCHGAAGVAYIFSKFWAMTKNPIFYDTSSYWFKRTLDFSVFPDGVAGYKRFDNIKKIWINEHGLLEGVAGIGLAIIGHIFEDYSWDYCLMLNDL